MRVQAKPIIFSLVGVINTLIDFSLFIMLTQTGVHFFPANILSSGAALTVSYALNATFTFNARFSRKNVTSFFIITVIGLWILQPLVIAVAEPALQTLFTASQSLIVAKFLATAVSLLWNYFLYKNIVFPSRSYK